MKHEKNKDFDRMIVEAVQENYSFFAWHSVGGVIEKCEMKIKAFRKDYNEIELMLKDGQEVELAKVVAGDRVLNIYIPELSVSFSSEIKAITADRKVKLFIPLEFSFFERRKQQRVMPLAECFVCFEHNRQVIKKSIYDISIGGIAIIMAKSEKMNITKGKYFSLFILDFGSRKIKMNAECTNSFVINRFKHDNLPYGGFKIAFRFLDLSKEDKAFINEFIAHEAIRRQVLKNAN